MPYIKEMFGAFQIVPDPCPYLPVTVSHNHSNRHVTVVPEKMHASLNSLKLTPCAIRDLRTLKEKKEVLFNMVTLQGYKNI